MTNSNQSQNGVLCLMKILSQFDGPVNRTIVLAFINQYHGDLQKGSAPVDLTQEL
jgi:hypothetical protein